MFEGSSSNLSLFKVLINKLGYLKLISVLKISSSDLKTFSNAVLEANQPTVTSIYTLLSQLSLVPLTDMHFHLQNL